MKTVTEVTKIGQMQPGTKGYSVPWAVAACNGHFWMRSDYTVKPNKGGTVALEVRCIRHGEYELSLNCYFHSFKYDWEDNDSTSQHYDIYVPKYDMLINNIDEYPYKFDRKPKDIARLVNNCNSLEKLSVFEKFVSRMPAGKSNLLTIEVQQSLLGSIDKRRKYLSRRVSTMEAGDIYYIHYLDVTFFNGKYQVNVNAYLNNKPTEASIYALEFDGSKYYLYQYPPVAGDFIPPVKIPASVGSIYQEVESMRLLNVNRFAGGLDDIRRSIPEDNQIENRCVQIIEYKAIRLGHNDALDVWKDIDMVWFILNDNSMLFYSIRVYKNDNCPPFLVQAGTKYVDFYLWWIS